jgi:hypothetical protein
MSRNTKIAIAIGIGLVVLCICVCVGGWIALTITGSALGDTMAVDSPEEAAAVAQSVIDYDLPPGYQEEMAINVLFMKMVVINKGDLSSGSPSTLTIFIVGMPSDMAMDEDEVRLQFQRQMRQAMNRQDWHLRLVDEEMATIRGQEVSLFLYEGTDDMGAELKQVVSSVFEGKNGNVMFWIMGLESEWDQTEIDAFINSLR